MNGTLRIVTTDERQMPAEVVDVRQKPAPRLRGSPPSGSAAPAVTGAL